MAKVIDSSFPLLAGLSLCLRGPGYPSKSPLLASQPGHSSETVLALGTLPGPHLESTVWGPVWAAACLDHSEPHFLSSLIPS